MPIPVKTQILSRIKTLISGVTGINSVVRNPSKPIDRDLTKYDAAFVFDDEETPGEPRNRVQMKSFPLHVEVWIRDDSGGEAIGDLADIYQAEVNKTLLNDATLWGLVTGIFEGVATKFYADENLGGIILLYTIHYGHKYKDPYDLVRA